MSRRSHHLQCFWSLPGHRMSPQANSGRFFKIPRIPRLRLSDVSDATFSGDREPRGRRQLDVLISFDEGEFSFTNWWLENSEAQTHITSSLDLPLRCIVCGSRRIGPRAQFSGVQLSAPGRNCPGPKCPGPNCPTCMPGFCLGKLNLNILNVVQNCVSVQHFLPQKVSGRQPYVGLRCTLGNIGKKRISQLMKELKI